MDLSSVRKLLGMGKSIADMPLRVVYYARVSTDSKEQLVSLDNQIEYFDRYIKSNPNWTFGGAYVDEGISAGTVDKRDAFLRMVADAKADKFDLIVTKEICRFARDTLDSLQYTRKLLDVGVGVYFQQDNIVTLEGDGEMRLTIMASLAQDEIRRLSERVRFGMKRAYENGKVLGQGNIYGYDKAGGKLVINEKEAAFVRALFALYAEGKHGYRTIVRALSDMGYRNQEGNELNPGSIKGIITNPKYKGYYCGRKTESSDYLRKKNIKLPEDDRLLYKDENIPAIVSEELWDKANAILNGRSKKFHGEGKGVLAKFPYSGKLLCEEHGTHLYRKLWKDRKVPVESWCCKEYMAKGRYACATPQLRTKDLDAIMEYIGNDLLSNKERYVKSVDELIRLYQQAEGGKTDYALETAKILKEIEKIKTKQDKILELYAEGEIEKADYLERNNRLKDQATKLNRDLAILREEQAAANGSTDTLERVREFFGTLTAGENGNALEVARAMLDNVVVLKGSTKQDMRLRITMKYGESLPCAILNTNILCGETEISPIVGTQKQSEDLIDYFNNEMAENPGKIWELNMFGKSMHDMVREGLSGKLHRMPEDAQEKMQEALQKIINEGNGGLICILL